MPQSEREAGEPEVRIDELDDAKLVAGRAGLGQAALKEPLRQHVLPLIPGHQPEEAEHVALTALIARSLLPVERLLEEPPPHDLLHDPQHLSDRTTVRALYESLLHPQVDAERGKSKALSPAGLRLWGLPHPAWSS